MIFNRCYITLKWNILICMNVYHSYLEILKYTIVFEMFSALIFIGVWYLVRSRTQPATLSNTLLFTMNLNVSRLRKKHETSWFPSFCSITALDLLMVSGIDFGFIFGAFWLYFQCFCRDRVSMDFFYLCIYLSYLSSLIIYSFFLFF